MAPLTIPVFIRARVVGIHLRSRLHQRQEQLRLPARRRQVEGRQPPVVRQLGCSPALQEQPRRVCKGHAGRELGSEIELRNSTRALRLLPLRTFEFELTPRLSCFVRLHLPLRFTGRQFLSKSFWLSRARCCARCVGSLDGVPIEPTRGSTRLPYHDYLIDRGG